MKEMMLLGSGGGLDRGEDRFLGEVPDDQLIRFDILTSNTGVTAGDLHNSRGSWLAFILDGKLLYVAKKPLRRNLTYSQLAGRDLVSGNRIITISGSDYRIRLINGGPSDPVAVPASGHIDHSGTWGSEWNRLMYRIIPNPTYKENIPTFPLSGEGIRFGEWAEYTNVDLDIRSGQRGSLTICSESIEEMGWAGRLGRGGACVTVSRSLSVNTAQDTYGWRPVLELVE